jgi:hypothetical protein
VRGSQKIFLDPSIADGQLHENAKVLLPLRKIRGAVHFASKSESKALQLADVCAFLIRGHYAKHPHNWPLYRRIRRALALIPYKDVHIEPEIRVATPYIFSRKPGPLVVGPGGHLLKARA